MTYRSLSLVLLLAACGDDALPADASTPRDSGADMQDSGRDAHTNADAGDDVRDAGRDAPTLDSEPAADANIPDVGSPDVSGPCRPFTSAGCDVGFWCKPQDTDVSEGVCERHGDQDSGEVCITNIDCVAGAVCGERAEGGVCDQTCDPESPQGSEQNPCMSGTRCSNLRDTETGEPIALGICVPACDYDAGVPCFDPDLTCEPNELISGEVDVCLPGVTNLPAQGDCALAGVPHGQLCGPSRICLDRADLRPGNLCYQVCREDVGRLNAAEHPDCDPAQICTQFAVGLGVCL